MKLSRDDNVKQLVVEFQNGKFSECEKEAISLLEHYKDDYFLYTHYIANRLHTFSSRYGINPEVANFNGVFVVDEVNTLKGVITDGDIRRKLLKGYKLEDSVIEVMNIRISILGLLIKH